MGVWLRTAALLLLTLSSAPLAAEVRAVYEFDSREQEMRFQTLIAELRCPKCQNQNIADSNAPISKDMRDAVYRMMSDGASNEEITNELVSRFGEFVRYRTEVERRTFLLWATPFLVVFIGIVAITLSVRRSSRAVTDAVPLSDEERERASRLLNARDGDDRSS
jgi:cytochrome c-type biogenesis protein CcmH